MMKLEWTLLLWKARVSIFLKCLKLGIKYNRMYLGIVASLIGKEVKLHFYGKTDEKAEEYRANQKGIYKMITKYIEKKYGFKEHSVYIAEVKRGLGLPMYNAPYAVEETPDNRKGKDKGN